MLVCKRLNVCINLGGGAEKRPWARGYASELSGSEAPSPILYAYGLYREGGGVKCYFTK